MRPCIVDLIEKKIPLQKLIYGEDLLKVQKIRFRVCTEVHDKSLHRFKQVSSLRAGQSLKLDGLWVGGVLFRPMSFLLQLSLISAVPCKTNQFTLVLLCALGADMVGAACSSMSSIFIHFSSASIHFHPLLSIFIHFYPPPSIFSHIHPPLSIFIHLYQFSSTVIRYPPLSVFIYLIQFFPPPSICIHSRPFSSLSSICIHFIRFYLFSSTIIRFHPLLSTTNHFHSYSSTVVHFHPFNPRLPPLIRTNSTNRFFTLSLCWVVYSTSFKRTL